MNHDPVITVENLGKRYVLGRQSGNGAPYRTLREDVADAISAPFRRMRTAAASRGKNGHQTALATPPGNSDAAEEFWALRHVSFEINRGEVVGVIGRNGAGKSTLLKILSRITEPTEGRIEIQGRVASLLEVGTGFHPELTGRENIFLNGAILGMKNTEIRRKFDEIVAFAEIERFLDTPVKRYSSGMYVRLAFAVAAHLDPEILVIDEVLAVGDIQFQKKCLGKMEDVAKGGRTVIFVSHNTGVLLNLCPKCILLENGAKIKEGPSPEVIAEYIKVGSQSVGEVSWELTDPRAGNDNLRLHQARILCQGEVTGEVSINREVILQFDFDVLRNDLLVSSSIHLHDKQGVWVLCSGTATSQLARGMHQHEYVFPANFFNDGLYTLTLFLITKVTQIEVCVRDAISFTVHETGFGREEYGGAIGGCVRPLLLTKEKVLTQLAEP